MEGRFGSSRTGLVPDAAAPTLAAPPGLAPGAGGLAGAEATVEPVAAQEHQAHDHAAGQPARRQRARAVMELAGEVKALGIIARAAAPQAKRANGRTRGLAPILDPGPDPDLDPNRRTTGISPKSLGPNLRRQTRAAMKAG